MVDMTPIDDRPADVTAGDPDTPPAPGVTPPPESTPWIPGGPTAYEVEPLPEPYTEAEARALLETTGRVLNGFLPGLPDDDDGDLWLFTGNELRVTAPTLARVVNKRRRLSAAIRRADEVVLIGALGQYAWSRMQALGEARSDADAEVDAGGGPQPTAGI